MLIFAEGKKAILIDPQGYNYSRYVAFIDNEIATQAISDHEQQHSKKVISLPLPSNQETTITVAPVKQKYLVHYRNWVSGLLSSDRLTEIVDYQAWEDNHSEEIIKKQYREFIEDCLKSDRFSEIVDYQTWAFSS